MRKLVRDLIQDARRSGDRVGVDQPLDMPDRLGTDLVRLARLATSIHLVDAAGSLETTANTTDRRLVMREHVR